MIDLWGNVDPHIQFSISLLQGNEPDIGYYLAFSGGKDSIVVYDLMKNQAKVKFDAHYMRAMEPPELVYFIRKNYPDVKRHLPRKTMWRMIKDHGIFPLRTIRYCCSELKEIGGKGRVVVTGIRRQESSKRRMRKEYEAMGDKILLSPILHWSNEQVWEYIYDHNLVYPSLYDPPDSFKRIGCVMCPCSSPQQMQLEAKRWPKIADAYRRAGNRFFDPSIAHTWKTGDDMYQWWLSGKTFGPEPTLWDESEV